MKHNCFRDFEFMSALTEPKKETFQLVMKMTILNLDIRFPCPGFSLDITQAKQNTHNFTQPGTNIVQRNENEMSICDGG